MNLTPHFRKTTLAEGVAEGLRSSILQGVWKKHLPAERTLCEQIGTSRPTLRRAIHILEKEGKVRTRRSALTEILIPSRSRRTDKRPTKILLLAGTPSYASSQFALTALDEIRKELYRRGCHYEFLLDQRVLRPHPGLFLKKLTTQYAADCWILASVPHSVQAWFQSHRIQAVTLGSAFDDIRTPSVDADHRAVARHAVGMCAAMGHRRTAYLQRHDRTAGEDQASAGVREALKLNREMACTAVPHSGTIRDLHARLKELFRHPQPPTALLISHASDTLVVFIWLLRAGLRVPQDVSVLTLRYEDMLSALTPPSSHYEMNAKRTAASICRLVLNPASRGGKIRLIPKFVPGGTLAKVAVADRP